LAGCFQFIGSIPSVETKLLSRQSSYAQAATEHNEYSICPHWARSLPNSRLVLAISNINAAGTGIHSTTRYHRYAKAIATRREATCATEWVQSPYPTAPEVALVEYSPYQPRKGSFQSKSIQDSSGISKGMKQVLQKRSLRWAGLLTQYKIEDPNKAFATRRRPRILLHARHTSESGRFRASRSQIEEIIKEAGHLIIFYPFHPELNWIEYYWGACKYFARRRCNYSFTGLREIVPKALGSVSPSPVYKCWARSKRILNSYCAGSVYGDE
jgi:hypothetical protein